MVTKITSQLVLDYGLEVYATRGVIMSNEAQSSGGNCVKLSSRPIMCPFVLEIILELTSYQVGPHHIDLEDYYYKKNTWKHN